MKYLTLLLMLFNIICQCRWNVFIIDFYFFNISLKNMMALYGSTIIIQNILMLNVNSLIMFILNYLIAYINLSSLINNYSKPC